MIVEPWLVLSNMLFLCIWVDGQIWLFIMSAGVVQLSPNKLIKIPWKLEHSLPTLVWLEAILGGFMVVEWQSSCLCSMNIVFVFCMAEISGLNIRNVTEVAAPQEMQFCPSLRPHWSACLELPRNQWSTSQIHVRIHSYRKLIETN